MPREAALRSARNATPSISPDDPTADKRLALPDVYPSGYQVGSLNVDTLPAPIISATEFPTPWVPSSIEHITFKRPPNPSIPQDVSMIMEMVATHRVVGSLPPLDMAVAEKRRLVEESMRERKGKVKEETLAPPIVDQSSDESASEENDKDDSSEEMSSDETDTEGEENQGPLTDAKHRKIKSEIDDLIGTNSVEFDFSSSPVPSPRPPRKPLEMLDDDEETSAGPIFSTNEASLPPVPQPPMHKLPEGEALRLAGDVVSWMRDRKVETWMEKERVKGEAKEHATDQDDGGNNVSEDAKATVEEEKTTMALPMPGLEDGEIEGEGQETNGNAPQQEGSLVGSVKDSEAKSLSLSMKRRRPSISSPTNRFTSAGTVVVRAMQVHPGSGDEGWLEEGSVVCYGDGRVLGSVTETFGPLTSPFYQIRLPPPPFPYPAPESLATGSKLFYPKNPRYRTFINMHAVRDPRFKGSDASNFYDEEIGEDEQEWSDDEAEAEAKRRRKSRRGGSKASVTPFSDRATSRPEGIAGLPKRPHFDYQPADSTNAGSETGSLYGGDDDGSIYAESDATSTSGGRERPMPTPYEMDDYPTSLPVKLEPMSPVSADVRQGQGRDRGRGRGGRDRRGGGDRGRGRGGRPSRKDYDQSDDHEPHAPVRTPPSLPLPPRPRTNSGPTNHYSQQNRPSPFSPQHFPFPQQYHTPQRQQYHQSPPNHHFQPNRQSPQHRPPQQWQQPLSPAYQPVPPQNASRPQNQTLPFPQYNSQALQYPQRPYTNHPQPLQYHRQDDQYHPNQPSIGMAFQHTPPLPPTPMSLNRTPFPPSPNGFDPTPFPNQQPYLPPPPTTDGAQSPNAPAINPRFAAQYQQMHMLNMGGFPNWPSQGGQGQYHG